MASGVDFSCSQLLSSNITCKFQRKWLYLVPSLSFLCLIFVWNITNVLLISTKGIFEKRDQKKLVLNAVYAQAVLIRMPNYLPNTAVEALSCLGRDRGERQRPPWGISASIDDQMALRKQWLFLVVDFNLEKEEVKKERKKYCLIQKGSVATCLHYFNVCKLDVSELAAHQHRTDTNYFAVFGAAV